MGQITINLAY